MAHINLLPWREWERERKKKEFLGNLAGVIDRLSQNIRAAFSSLPDQLINSNVEASGLAMVSSSAMRLNPSIELPSKRL